MCYCKYNFRFDFGTAGEGTAAVPLPNVSVPNKNNKWIHVVTELSRARVVLYLFSSSSRGTQRIVSVEYLFGRAVIASNFRLGKCHLELS